ncbi:RND transporter [Halorientalis sp. IM1011]|uniref:MMPL family transporter n=1 Tax=Halorientalis sp. IM1011 TaxID=1932360 RepID=UPI00097CC53C|nr:MMPL family transporter [Halorientalis sp. IM1011]AQL42369.1 RND transporter [Halorientalis sp. IM1011]
MDYQRVIDRIDETIVERPGRIILAFLLVTAVFAVGLGNISTSAGTSQFTTGLPAEEAFTQVNEEFSPSFATDTGSTSLIQREGNVLSKQSMLAMLRAQERIKDRDAMRVSSTGGAAQIVARQLDPQATTLEEQIDAVEDASDSQIDQAVQQAAERSPQFAGLLSNDFNRRSATATATIGSVSHEVPAGLSTGSGQGGTSPLTPIQEEVEFAVESVDGNIQVFGAGILAGEFANVITDSLLIVVPAAVIFITLFLTIAYRDLVDLLLGVVALLLTIVWTFGFMGLAGIPFSQMLIAVPPLLLAVGIDFGIHAINRYREERVLDRGIGESMRITTDQLIVAFFIVTGTTVIGFAANLISDLGPIKDFGLVAGIGITFTFLIFGIFLPAAKVWIDRKRERYPIPTFSQTPLGSEGSALGKVLRGGVIVADRAPAIFLILILLGTAGAGYYATGVDTSFAQEDFLPPEENPDWVMELPEPFRPHEYTVTETTNYLEDKFDSTQSDSVTMYVQGPLEKSTTLDSIHRAGRDPPDTIITGDDRQAESTSIVTVIQDQAERDEEFGALVARNDVDDDGIPDQNLGTVYDALLDSPARDQALSYMTENRRSTRVVYTVEADAEQSEITADAREMADDYRLDAVATGQTVVFQAVSDVIFESALESLVVALIGATLFLIVVYRVFEDSATLGIANVVPIVVTVTLVAGSMRFLDIPFNAITATILAITIGLGIDYSVHVTHRFADERREYDLVTALDRTVRGTGGALLGSMFTTVFGIGVLALALFPAIGQFGTLTALSIVYAFTTSIFVLPSALVLWDRFVGYGPGAVTTGGGGGPSPDLSPGSATGTPNPDTAPSAENASLAEAVPGLPDSGTDGTTNGGPTAGAGGDAGPPVDGESTADSGGEPATDDEETEPTADADSTAED